MKRFSVLALLIAIIFSTTNLLYKQTHYTEVKETDYGSQEIKRVLSASFVNLLHNASLG